MNTLYLITGASGSGKSTLLHSIMDNELISFTTRKPREGEKNGVDYLFLSKDEFEYLNSTKGLAEKSEYAGNYYGLTQKEIDNKMKNGNGFFICNHHGKQQMQEIYKNCVSIFIMADYEEIKQNMIDRGDSQESITKRLSTYDEEIKNSIEYDFIVVNKRGQFEETKNKIKHIMRYLNE